ncbi:uncharacterized protein LY89DRAFT_709465 [Mollisia scopiformis]|uniref:T6SS Phospholipase effector Tle1-like catalytic domain-containing protein n=1 Tax=Mollisia scopiformis TaxID=149040 RepID=A0A194WYD8_MOLSC|nr:uncharacterized protein LY89DRAFT_709465 [Mollisia scopiformis]KUJ12983.1 hypothetical protein LY89DRAFT_709465 [Mollisia scopiformis]
MAPQRGPTKRTEKRLVLCFDGTSNRFKGNETDTNIVKIYEMLDRNIPDQFHYYQPGIGSYVEGQMSNSSGGNIFTRARGLISTSVDSAFGTSFVQHVIAGYRFLMRYWNEGDKIYIFGFSRGAYTARFLAEMLCNIGLLSCGNEEMIRFAWSTFSDFQTNRSKDPSFKAFMEKFKETFCRGAVKPHFLGLFDCVNSVGQFDIPLFRTSLPYMPMSPAKHIRHAIAIHERRLRFKSAHFLFDLKAPIKDDIKEVYFAGNHGDVGGGWSCNGEKYLLSDITLRWMVQEVLDLPDTVSLSSNLAYRNLNATKPIREGPYHFRDLVHDCLPFGGGSGWFEVLAWWIVGKWTFLALSKQLSTNNNQEWVPFSYGYISDGKWVSRQLPPNLGSRRDIPVGADIHPSVMMMNRAGVLPEDQMPRMGGEELYNAQKPLSFLRPLIKVPKTKKPKPDEINALRSGESLDSEESGNRWSFDRMMEIGAKTWDLL